MILVCLVLRVMFFVFFCEKLYIVFKRWDECIVWNFFSYDFEGDIWRLISDLKFKVVFCFGVKSDWLFLLYWVWEWVWYDLWMYEIIDGLFCKEGFYYGFGGGFV